jgi:hypothetical protein
MRAEFERQKLLNPDYLGDGVYAAHTVDGCTFVCIDYGISSGIYLDDETFAALLRYRERIKQLTG